MDHGRLLSLPFRPHSFNHGDGEHQDNRQQHIPNGGMMMEENGTQQILHNEGLSQSDRTVASPTNTASIEASERIEKRVSTRNKIQTYHEISTPSSSPLRQRTMMKWYAFKVRPWMRNTHSQISGDVPRVLRPRYEGVHKTANPRARYKSRRINVRYRGSSSEDDNIAFREASSEESDESDTSIESMLDEDDTEDFASQVPNTRAYLPEDDEDLLLVDQLNEYTIEGEDDEDETPNRLQTVSTVGIKRKQEDGPLGSNKPLGRPPKSRRLDTNPLLMNSKKRIRAQWQALADAVNRTLRVHRGCPQSQHDLEYEV